MRKYIKGGGDDLEDQANILKFMTQLDTKFQDTSSNQGMVNQLADIILPGESLLLSTK